MTARPPQPLEPPAWRFPDPATADRDGVVGIGADLEPATLVHAYRHGIFPWPHHGVALPWFSPDPRGLITPSSLHVSRSLRRTLRRSGWQTTLDVAFDRVIAGCADRDEEVGTWITSAMRGAYTRLHDLGWAHSVEVWQDDTLVGGLYGVQVGACFTGESMFHRESDASKVALVDLVDRLEEAGGEVVDVQIPTPHLRSLGAFEVGRDSFLARLAVMREADVHLRSGQRRVARLADRDRRPQR